MVQSNKEDEQVLYLERWVNKEHFRTFVYSEKEKLIANSYQEYEKLISSGLWFSEPRPLKKRKSPKGVEQNGYTNTNC